MTESHAHALKLGAELTFRYVQQSIMDMIVAAAARGRQKKKKYDRIECDFARVRRVVTNTLTAVMKGGHYDGFRLRETIKIVDYKGDVGELNLCLVPTPSYNFGYYLEYLTAKQKRKWERRKEKQKEDKIRSGCQGFDREAFYGKSNIPTLHHRSNAAGSKSPGGTYHSKVKPTDSPRTVAIKKRFFTQQ